MSEPEIGHARPLLYPDSRPEPAARRAANPSIERERDAHLHLPLLLWRSQSRFKARKSPSGYSDALKGLKRLKTQNTASYDCNAKWERPYLALPNLYTSANSFRKKNSSTLPTLVEMRRVELLSESISARISPSAAADLNFAKQDAPRQASSSAIPSFPCASGSRHRVFLYNWRRDSDLQVNQSRRRGRFMRQAAMLQMRNYCYF